MIWKLKLFFEFLHIYTSRSQVENKLSKRSLITWWYTVTITQSLNSAVGLGCLLRHPHFSDMPSVTAETSDGWGCWRELAERAGRQHWCHWIIAWKFATGLDRKMFMILKYVHFLQDSTEQPFDSWHKGCAVPSSTLSSGRQPWGWCPSNPSSMKYHSGKSTLINMF